MAEKTLNIGILSAANIAQKNVDAMKGAKGVVPKCMAARDPQRAQEFVKEFGLDCAHQTYEDLIADDRLDIIYMPLPTVFHAEWLPKVVGARKHILCEKPLASDAKELHAMLQKVRAADVAFMDGAMFPHHVRLELMQQKLTEGVIGPAGARSVNSVFSFRGDSEFFADNIRVKVEPFGCLGDLGWYNIRLSLWAFHYELPVEVRGIIHSATEAGIPTCFTGVMKWADDAATTKPPTQFGVGAPRTATFFCSFLHATQQWASVMGDTGFIEMNDFMLPMNPKEAAFMVVHQTITDQDRRMERDATKHTVNDCVQEVRMWEQFADIIHHKDKRLHWMRTALANQLVMDALMESARNGGRAVKPDPENLMSSYQK